MPTLALNNDKTVDVAATASADNDHGGGDNDISRERTVSFEVGDDRTFEPKEAPAENDVEGLSTTTTAVRSAASTPAAFLSMPCRTLAQDGFLERLSLSDFHSVMHVVGEFIIRCRMLIGTNEKFSVPLQRCIVQQSTLFVKRFHDDRKTKLRFLQSFILEVKICA
ncbi:unnamed protein product [Gongylonema pulchrum]|uniref:Uncharacterized protein n=1 Tax=Gongylonema pulchrum TaxID=637853 RepID=A0A183D9E6_9BILA|nr:unnamed protein product [Gongylonema pulchrum]